MQTKEKPDEAGNPNEKAIKDSNYFSDNECITAFNLWKATAKAEAEAANAPAEEAPAAEATEAPAEA